MAKIRITVSIEQAVVKKTDRAAKALGMSRSAFMEDALEEALTEQEAFVSMMKSPILRDAFMSTFSRPEVMRQMLKIMAQDVDGDQLEMFQEKVGKGLEAVKRALHEGE